MKFTFKAKTRGTGEIFVGKLDDNGNVVEKTKVGNINNLVLDNALYNIYLGRLPIIGANINVGDGDSEPLLTDDLSSMGTFVESLQTNGVPTFNGFSASCTYTGQLAVVETKTFASIGLYNSSGLITRALIKNNNGEPTPITVEGGYYLFATYIISIDITPPGSLSVNVTGGPNGDTVLEGVTMSISNPSYNNGHQNFASSVGPLSGSTQLCFQVGNPEGLQGSRSKDGYRTIYHLRKDAPTDSDQNLGQYVKIGAMSNVVGIVFHFPEDIIIPAYHNFKLEIVLDVTPEGS